MKANIIYEVLSADQSVTNITETIRPLHGAQQFDTIPAIYYFTVDTNAVSSKEKINFLQVRYQVDVLHNSFSGLETLCLLIIQALDNHSSETVSRLWFDSAQDFFEDEVDIYRRALDFIGHIKI